MDGDLILAETLLCRLVRVFGDELAFRDGVMRDAGNAREVFLGVEWFGTFARILTKVISLSLLAFCLQEWFKFQRQFHAGKRSEGFMLRKPDAPYVAGRSKALLKLKS